MWNIQHFCKILLPILFLLAKPLTASLFPGLLNGEFKLHEEINVKAVKLTSVITQLPYDYYELQFCHPSTPIKYEIENIGQVIKGDRIVNTPYVLKTADELTCSSVCDDIPIAEQEASKFKHFITEEYSVRLSLPGGFTTEYPLGRFVDGQTYLHNHLHFKLKYYTDDSITYRIVGFKVEPFSIDENHLKLEDGSCSSPISEPKMTEWKVIDKTTKKVRFTYDVHWERSEQKWASIWDLSGGTQGGSIHWFSLLNSTIVVVLLTSIISMILVRTLRRDIAKYNRIDAEDIIEESGWKLVHGDVFRPPRFVRLLTALIGTGVQIFSMVFIVILFAMMGMVSPAYRGTLMSGAIFTYVLMGLFAGYYAARIYKTLRGQHWMSTAFLTGMLFPSLVFAILSIINSFVWYKGSSRAVPFTTGLAIVSLWLGVSLPLTVVGFYFGFRKRPYELPTRTNQIPRAVPEQKCYNNTFIAMLCHGLLPFGVLFIEIFFIYMAIWESHIYYLFGFLFAVFTMFVICCAQVSIMMTYFQVCNEDYRWWWRIFIASGGSGFYLFLYSIFYFSTKLHITEFIPIVVYFGYSILMSMTLWILTGTVGLTSTFIFLRVIYSAIKVD